GKARARVSRGPEGNAQALLAALQAAALRTRGLREDRDQGGSADRADRGHGRGGGDADLRARASAAAPDRLDLLPDQPRLPALRRACRRDVPAREVPHPVPRAGAVRAAWTRRG